MTSSKVYKNVLETIGQTPMIHLNSITRGAQPTVLAKVELFNPGGSVKDRIAMGMIEEAEASGRLKPGGDDCRGHEWEHWRGISHRGGA